MAELDEAQIRLLEGRHIAALATIRSDGLIHLTAVWYLYEDGLLYVATGSHTRQVRNVEVSANLGWANPMTGSAMVMRRG